MDYNILKSIRTAGIIIAALAFSTAAHSVGPILAVLTNTIEGARIEVDVSDNDPSSGKVTATFLGCEQCEPISLPFDNQTVFVNVLGAKRPVSELKNANGRIAMIRYQKQTARIDYIRIIPEREE